MGEALILETTFLLDLERELNRGQEGAAQKFLERHERDRLYITPTIAGELAAGASLSHRKEWEAFVRPFSILATNEEVAWHSTLRSSMCSGILDRESRRRGQG